MNNIEEYIPNEHVYKTTDDFNASGIVDSEDLLILHFNIRSIHRNIELLEAYLSTITKKPDLIFCSEAWLNTDKGFDEIEGYIRYSNNSTLNRADGVILYVNHNLKHQFAIESDGNLNTANVIVETKQAKIKFTGLYRCHDYPVKNFIADCKDLLIRNKEWSNHVIIGDDNIDTIDEELDSCDYLSNMLEYQYLPYINSITRPRDSGGTCIDHIFIKCRNLVAISGKIEQNITDHYPIFTAIKNEYKDETVHFKSINYNKITNLAGSVNWNDILSIREPTEALAKLTEKIKELIRQCTRKIHNKKTYKRKNWMTYGLMCSCNTKQKLYNAWKKDNANMQLKNEYCAYSNKLRHLLRLAKNNYDKRRLKNANIKDFWKFIKEKTNKTMAKKKSH